MTKFGQLVVAFIIVGLLGAGIFWLMAGDKNVNPGGLPEFDFAQSLKNAGDGNFQPAEGSSTYENAYWGFSFNYAGDFKVSEIDEENGAFTVLAEGTGEKRTFQIFIADFEEEGPITPDRIKKDLPDIKIEQPQTISFAGTEALAFISPDEQGKMVEIWFVYGGALYQIRSYFELTDELSKILASWQFME